MPGRAVAMPAPGDFMKSLPCLTAVLASALLSGCILAPGTSTRTMGIAGRVVSAGNHRPVSGAQVALHAAPQLRSTKSGADGRFELRKSKNFHLFLFLGMCGPEYNILPYVDDRFIDVSHPAFAPRRVDIRQNGGRINGRAATKDGTLELRDIVLTPRSR